jgi:hypothetical protein
MTQETLLSEMIKRLEAAGIPFMVTGSHGSSYHGRPRTTYDLDLVIDPDPTQLEAFLASLGDRYYGSREAARDAFSRRSMFNVIDFASGWKVDLIFRKDRPFSVEEFGRRQVGLLQGCRVPIASAEDIILSKLEWNAITPSERQLQDALDVAIANWQSLDQGYLRKWAPVLGVTDQLQIVLEKAAKEPS